LEALLPLPLLLLLLLLLEIPVPPEATFSGVTTFSGISVG
jgi:hypothetical protein